MRLCIVLVLDIPVIIMRAIMSLCKDSSFILTTGVRESLYYSLTTVQVMFGYSVAIFIASIVVAM